MDTRAIGIFDSGLGGLTAVRQLKELLPNEHIIFLGDTARIPYGIRVPEVIREFSRNDISFLLSKKVKCVAAACGTVSSNISPHDLSSVPVPFFGIIEPTARCAVETTRNGRIGVIATQATVASGAFRKAINNLDANVSVFSKACPDFVPLIEGGALKDDRDAVIKAARRYLTPLREKDVDTLILGCTHYPLISDIIQDIMGSDVSLIDSGAEEAKRIADHLRSASLLTDAVNGSCEFYVTSDRERFSALAELFINEDVSNSVTQLTEKEFYLIK